MLRFELAPFEFLHFPSVQAPTLIRYPTLNLHFLQFIFKLWQQIDFWLTLLSILVLFKHVRCSWIITTTARNSVFAGIDMMMHLVRHIEGLVVPTHAGIRWQDEGLHGPPDRGFSEAHFNLVWGLPVDFKVLWSFFFFNKHETLATGLQVANQPADVTLFLPIWCILVLQPRLFI